MSIPQLLLDELSMEHGDPWSDVKGILDLCPTVHRLLLVDPVRFNALMVWILVW